MAYPSTLDSFTNPTANQTLNAPSHSTIETAQNTAAAALETKVGIDSSAVVTTIDYLLKNTTSSDPGHKHTFASLSQFTVGASPAVNDILQYNGTKWVNNPAASLALKFGGTGADGALNISSGTTTIDCANVAVVVKNYTSISITGTGILAFSNPHANGTTVILKSQGAVTLTSSQAPMINMSAMGAIGGTGVSGAANGNAGSASISLSYLSAGGGGGGSGAGGGTGGTINALSYQSANTKILSGKYPFGFCGGGGGSGQSGSGTTGAGGRGGGCLVIECGGVLNFTTSGGLSVAGGAGGSPTGGTGGGSGGGGGGFCGVFYNTLTAASGTITVTGGSGGAANTSTNSGGGGGAITAGSTGVGQSSGGAGAAGLSLMVANTEFS